MKKNFKIVRNVFIGIFLFIYLSFIVIISTLLLNRNDYGITQFGKKALIIIDEKISNEKYKEGSLVIVENKKVSELEIGNEIFVYKTNKKEKTVQIIISDIGEINADEKNPYVVLKNDGTSWGEEFIAGTYSSSYEKLGTFIAFIESKWVFFSLLIVPCFFILLYEIHLVIVTLKFGDMEDDEEEKQYKNAIESKNEEIEALMKQIKELKAANNEIKEETTKIEDDEKESSKETEDKKESSKDEKNEDKEVTKKDDLEEAMKKLEKIKTDD